MLMELKLDQCVEMLPYSPEVSPASHTALQENVRDLLMSVTSGQSSGESLASLNPGGFWVKMCRDCYQVTLEGSFQEYSENWPKWGIMSGGVVMKLPGLVLPIVERGCSSWPTPTVADCYTDKLKSTQQKPGSMHSVNLSQAVKMWPTPTATMYKGSSPASLTRKDGKSRLKDRLDHAVMGSDGGQLNPDWVEWLMGFPQGWTDLSASGMR